MDFLFVKKCGPKWQKIYWNGMGTQTNLSNLFHKPKFIKQSIILFNVYCFELFSFGVFVIFTLFKRLQFISIAANGMSKTKKIPWKENKVLAKKWRFFTAKNGCCRSWKSDNGDVKVVIIFVGWKKSWARHSQFFVLSFFLFSLFFFYKFGLINCCSVRT